MIISVSEDSRIGIIEVTNPGQGYTTMSLQSARGGTTTVRLNHTDLKNLVDALIDCEPHAVFDVWDAIANGPYRGFNVGSLYTVKSSE